LRVSLKEKLLMSSRATLAHISALIKAKRRENEIGLRDAAEASGVSASTLSRLERGAATSLPDSATLTKIAEWLGLSLAALLSDKTTAIGSRPELSTPEVVEVHLRADRELSPETAKALAEMFKTLYRHCLQTQESKEK
jgi:transcriptional regulator with XRE-family HTH domain